jgi:hypothetical protein
VKEKQFRRFFSISGTVLATASATLFVNARAFAQANASAPSVTASPASDQVNRAGDVAEAERVIVTGSNIPTAEEVGPNPVDTYRSEDIEKLGVRTPPTLSKDYRRSPVSR